MSRMRSRLPCSLSATRAVRTANSFVFKWCRSWVFIYLVRGDFVPAAPFSSLRNFRSLRLPNLLLPSDFCLLTFPGAPGPIRTGDPRLRRAVLYPSELRAHYLRGGTSSPPHPPDELTRSARLLEKNSGKPRSVRSGGRRFARPLSFLGGGTSSPPHPPDELTRSARLFEKNSGKPRSVRSGGRPFPRPLSSLGGGIPVPPHPLPRPRAPRPPPKNAPASLALFARAAVASLGRFRP